MEEKQELLRLLEQKRRIRVYNFRDELFPAEGPLSRDKYERHLAFFKAGKTHKQRAMICANQVGKSLSCAYEVMLHLTGDYPDWWEGIRFDHAVECWAAGFKANVRESIQEYLVGSPNNPGTGMIPRAKIDAGRLTRKAGVVDTFQDIYIPHRMGGFSRCTLKTYDEKVKAFQGARLDLIWLDEEPEDATLYAECMTRLVAKEGYMMCSFTPLRGLSDTVLSFLDNGKMPDGGLGDINGKFVVNITWDDVPHLSEEFKKELASGYLPHQLEARTKGIPALGAGAIYPIKEEEVVIDNFPIPKHWPKAYGMDVGWNRTAAIFGAYDPESDIWYLYNEYYRSQAEPSIHADAIKARGKWMYGVIDPASRGVSQTDGKRLANIYADLGLELAMADNGVEAGLLECWQRLSSGRCKIFKSCQNWLNEFRIYRRDEKGRIIKKDDHLMDAWRYLMMSGKSALSFDPSLDNMDDHVQEDTYLSQSDRSSVTGY